MLCYVLCYVRAHALASVHLPHLANGCGGEADDGAGVEVGEGKHVPWVTRLAVLDRSALERLYR